MDVDLAALPDDVDALHRLIRDLTAERVGERAALCEAQTEIERLRLIVWKLQRLQFGRRAERLDGDQLDLGLEDLGADIARSTLANWVGGAAWWLEPLRDRLAAHVFASTKLFADDTPLPVLDPGRGRTKTGRLWVYARDDQPWSGPEPPAAVYFYSPDRRAERPVAHLDRFKGTLQVDGYAGFEQLTTRGIVLAACWAHTRRKFYDVHVATGSPIAAEALRRIAELYAIEVTIRGCTAEERRRVRAAQAQPLVDALKLWLEAELHRVPPRGGLADAIRYALVRWSALCRFFEDGRVELDTNTVERAIRPIALGRKNHLFAGSDGGADRWAIVCSLITTAKLNNREPYAYLKDVLERMTNGHPMSRLDELLPWNWQPSAVQPALGARNGRLREQVTGLLARRGDLLTCRAEPIF